MPGVGQAAKTKDGPSPPKAATSEAFLLPSGISIPGESCGMPEPRVPSSLWSFAKERRREIPLPSAGPGLRPGRAMITS
ncbi:hypothetical protein ATE76_23380 [Sphingopyxis sp. H093]|nr:hypothetical protein ATE76_23380 [Sphingopyxis sp. H093]